jgi:Mlc titration factor MtfA (ptsG expression regulator)
MHAGAGWRGLYQRWRAGREALPEALWRSALHSSPYARSLPPAQRQQLRALTTRFIRAKSFEGAAGISVCDTMRARIAVHACLPILNLGLEYYAEWVSIVIYPGDFRVRDEYMDDTGVVHRGIVDLCGQSLAHGPMVLSWEAIQEEDQVPSDRDLVIHECAHKLDVLNGDANGFPPLHPGMSARAWSQDFQAAYDRFCRDVQAGRAVRLDPYAAEDPAEFFAVASETFFTAPHGMRDDFPAVYAQLQRFYRQDPCSLLPAQRR